MVETAIASIGLTVALSILIIGALVLVVAGGRIAEWLAAHYGFGPVFPTAWKIIQWPVALACIILGVCVDLLLRTRLS